jgi:hypothetical protein
MNHRTRLYPLLVLALWLAYGLRLACLPCQSIWWDEGHSIFVASHPVAQIPTLPAMDVHPPAYFALVRGWQMLAGQSEFALRYLSVVFSLLTVALLWRFAAAIGGPRARAAAPLAALLAAVSPLHVAYAQEVRSYSLITLLALGSTFSLRQILFSCNPPRRRAVAVYAALTAACLYTHYFTVFLLLFHNLAWLVWALGGRRAGRLNRLWVWLAGQAGALLLFAPQLRLALRQISGYTNPNLLPPAPAEFLRQSWQAYTVGLTTNPAWAGWGMAVAAGALILGWLILLRQRSPFASTALFLAGWLAVPLAAYYAVLQRQPSFEPRYLMLITPALLLLLALPAAAINRQWLRAALFAAPLVVFAVGLFGYYFDEAYFKDNSAGVAAWLAAETTPADLVYADVPHPFHYYAARIPAPTRYLFVDIHTAANILTAEAAGRSRLFWVTWRGSDTDPRGVIPFLAEKYGQQAGQLDFRGYSVTWYNLPPNNTGFSLPVDLPPAEADFGDALRLDGAAFGGAPATGPAWAVLHFTLRQNTAVDYRVSVRLRGANGFLAAQVDKDLLNDRHFRTAAWPLADPALNQAINVYTLPLAPDTPPGPYRLEVVVYNNQPPYPAEGVFGPAAAPDHSAAIIGQITVAP